jgi:hypothetical protein
VHVIPSECVQAVKKFVTINPFWDNIGPLIHSEKGVNLYQAECDRRFCAKYAFAIADPASVAFVAEYLHPRAIEIGAGSGYWAWQLSQCEIDIVAYDIAPVDQMWEKSYFSPVDKETRTRLGILTRAWYPVQQGGPEMVKEHPDRTLFLCWPVRNTSMASQCLQYYQGQRFVYIGEYRTGTNGDDLFFDMLEQAWQEIARHEIVRWSGAHDAIIVYVRA